jgi:16S rRNA (guanine1207-N2)-methyltransferase
MSHYFIEDSSLSGDERNFSLSFCGAEFEFVSNAGMFSNGEADPNSLLLLRSISPENGVKMLDLGCGWGLIGTVAAKLYGVSPTFADINGIALSMSEKNARNNGVSGTFIKSDGFAEINNKFDLITLNPPIHAGKKTVLRLFSESALHLTENGQFVIVINEKHGAKTYKKRLEELFYNVDEEKYKNTFIFKCYGAKNAY